MALIRAVVFSVGFTMGVLLVFVEFDKFEGLLLSLVFGIACILVVGYEE